MKDLWDRLWEDGAPDGVHKELVETVIKYTGKQAKILEVGFGSGGDLLELAKRGYDVYGLEKSSEAIKRVKRKIRQGRKRDRGRVKIKSGDAEGLPFADQSFDCVFHQGVMEHFKSTGKFLHEQWRVLKDEGILVVDVPNGLSLWGLRRSIGTVTGTWRFGWERGYTDGELRQELERKGFEVLGTGYRGVWPPRLSKLLQPGEIASPFLRKLAEKGWIRMGAGIAGRILGEAKYGSVYAVAKRNKFFTDVAVDGRVFEMGSGGMAAYTLKVLTILGGIKFWVIHRRDLKVELPANCVNVRVRVSGKWVTDQVIIPQTLKRLGYPVYWEPANMGVPVFTKAKVLLTVHDVIPVYWNDYFSESRLPVVAKFLYKLRLQLGLWRADKVMTDSPTSKADLLRYFWASKKKIEIVPMGASLGRQSRFRKVETGILGKLGLESKGYILNHGGLDRRKNLDRLIEAFSVMKEIMVTDGGEPPAFSRSDPDGDDPDGDPDGGEVKLVVAGDETGIGENLRLRVHKLGIENRVIFTGRVANDEMQALVRNARLVVYPTLAEGFGLPLLEAMAAGVPVVASDIPVLKWIGGKVPFYVDPYSVESIAGGIGKALGRRRNGGAGRIQAGVGRAREFRWEGTAGKVLEEIKKLG